MSSKKVTGTCYFLGHSHIDAAWLWPFSETKEVFHNTCETILKLMDKYPNWCYCQSSAQYYKWLEEMYPETFDKVKQRVKEGRWEIVGGTWIEPDGNLPSGESYVRQYLYGKRYFKQKFGVDVQVSWMPDSFGYAYTLPQIMKKSGMRFFLTQKMSWNDTTLFPCHVFRWMAPDGSIVLAHQNVGSYSESISDEDMTRQMQTLISRQQLDDLLVLFGEGDHGGGVNDDMIKRAKTFVEGKKQLKGVFQTALSFFNTLSEKITGKRIPDIDDELYLQFHRGTYTTQSRVKKNNRRAECLLETAEKFSTLAARYGHRYPIAELKESWEKLLLNQFHDVLPGSSIPEVYRDSEEYFTSIFVTTNSIISDSLNSIAARVNTTGEGRPLIVFNPLSWLRSDVVEAPIKAVGELSEIYDDKGEIVPSQIVEEEEKLIFVAEDVPSIGYREYKAQRTGQTRRKLSTDLLIEENAKRIKLENEFLSVKVDKVTGHVTSVFDKKEKKEILSEHGNVIQVFDDLPVSGRKSVVYPIGAEIFDAWEIYIHQQKGGPRYIELKNPLKVQLTERGPVRARISIKYKYTQKQRPDSSFIQEIVLYHKIPLVQFRIRANWYASHKLAKVTFPLTIHGDYTTYEAPYGFITRMDYSSPKATPDNKAKYEVPGQKWIDHTSEDGSYGVSLLNDCKYGFDSANDVIRMTLLRSASYPIGMRRVFGLSVDASALSQVTDQGEHDIAYALYPHLADFRKALVARKAYEFNYPLMTVAEDSHDGVLPKTHSFVSIEPENVILTVIKKAEDTDDIILRLYETSGKDVKAVIRIDKTLKGAMETDLMENRILGISAEEKSIKLAISKNEIKSIRIT